MNESWEQYSQLRDRVLDGRASQDEIDQLQQLALNSKQMKRDYVEHAHQQAALTWRISETTPSPTDAIVQTQTLQEHSGRKRLAWYFLSLASAVLLTLTATWLLDARRTSHGVAMITSTENCRWGECSLATTEHRLLGPGRLRLQTGIAKLRFPNVDVKLEGAVDIQIVNEKRCILHAGRVFANVQSGGEGFTVQTPTAVLIDQGTTFGVNVLPTGTSDLRVFSGQVDVDHVSTGNKVSVKTDQHVRVSTTGVSPIGEVGEPAFQEQGETTEVSTRPVHLSTATGSGDDVYVSAQPHPPEHRSATALLVKLPPHAEPGDWGYPWRRKAFLKFDMSLLHKAEIREASLHLHGVETNIGFASLMPDATFAVYGLTDESQDAWTAETINWLNCPASLGDKLQVDPKKTLLIGKFLVSRSNPAGRFEVGGQALVDFLRTDTNGSATLIIIPETAGEGGAYVHGFASKRHSDLPAPTLRLQVQQNQN